MIVDIYSRAQMSQASYANLNGVENANQLETALTDPDDGVFFSTQAIEFARNWRVADHQPDTTSGFSATLFERLNDSGTGTGEFTLAMRGTRGFVDISEDLYGIAVQGIAREQAADLYRYYRRLTTPAGASVEYTTQEILILTALESGSFSPLTTSVAYIEVLARTTLDTGLGELGANTRIDITGHSLGGHLAMLFSVMFPAAVNHVYTYNGAGLGGIGAQILDFAGYNAVIPNHQVTNIVSDQGLDVTAGVGYVIGDTERIFIEQGSAIQNHSIANAVDSLAIHNLLASIDDAATLSELSAILAATDNHEDRARSYEDVVFAVSELLIDPIRVDVTDRDALYRAIQDIETELFVDRTAANPQLKPIYENLEVVSLPALSSAEMAERAQGDIGYRYALTHLNPFAILGSEALHEDHNDNGELDLFDPQTQEGELTEANLSDRAAFLATLNDFNTNNELVVGHNLIEFHDYVEGVSQTSATITAAGDSMAQQILFGDDHDDDFTGGGDEDRLYGGAGNDKLDGGDANDYLEGNAGIDKLHGGIGNDELYGGAGNDSGSDGGLLGGVGDDALYGEAGDDTLDGGTGRDLLVGGLGQDHLIGGDGFDNLYGDNRYFDEATNRYVLVDDGESDRLEGGLGDDLYYAGAGDVVNDLDGLGSVCMNITTGSGEQSYVMLGLNMIREVGTNVYEEYNSSCDATIRYTVNGNGTLTASEVGGGFNTITIENYSDRRLGINIGEEYNSPNWQSVTHVSYWFDWYWVNEYGPGDEYNVWWPWAMNLFDDAVKLESNLLKIPRTWERVLYDGDIDIVRGDDLDNEMTGSDETDRMDGGRGDDLLTGGAGDDWLNGGYGDDDLEGGEGQDTLEGGYGDDRLRGGPGEGDLLKGGVGNDTYLFGAGDGNTLINNFDAIHVSQDTLRFLPGIVPDDVRVGRAGDDLLLTVGNGAEVITVLGYFLDGGESPYSVDRIEFEDGTVWDVAHVIELLRPSGDGNDTLTGGEGNSAQDEIRDLDWLTHNIQQALTGTDLGAFGNDKLNSFSLCQAS